MTAASLNPHHSIVSRTIIGDVHLTAITQLHIMYYLLLLVTEHVKVSCLRVSLPEDYISVARSDRPATDHRRLPAYFRFGSYRLGWQYLLYRQTSMYRNRALALTACQILAKQARTRPDTCVWQVLRPFSTVITNFYCKYGDAILNTEFAWNKRSFYLQKRSSYGALL